MSASVSILHPEPSADERRRLREDVHDRLGPLLAGIGLGLGALAPLIDSSPEAAQLHLGELRGQMREAMAEVQRIIDGLAPVALDSQDPAEALRAFARRVPGVSIRVHAPDSLAGVPELVGAGVYAIALEAITNAIRHGRADRVDVHLHRSPTTLELTVSDDGSGLAGANGLGVGLRSMHGRAQRLGGSLTVQPHPAGGTSVQAHLPLGLQRSSSGGAALSAS
jgi:two-component system NarL family sensor kinase